MYCGSCGALIPDESTFCPRCGQPIHPVQPETNLQATQNLIPASNTVPYPQIPANPSPREQQAVPGIPGSVQPGAQSGGVQPGVQPGNVQPSAHLSGAQPGVQPGGMQPGVQPGNIQPGFQPGSVQPGAQMNGALPAVQPGGMQPGAQPGRVQPSGTQPGAQPGIPGGMQPGVQGVPVRQSYRNGQPPAYPQATPAQPMNANAQQAAQPQPTANPQQAAWAAQTNSAVRPGAPAGYGAQPPVGNVPSPRVTSQRAQPNGASAAHMAAYGQPARNVVAQPLQPGAQPSTAAYPNRPSPQGTASPQLQGTAWGQQMSAYPQVPSGALAQPGAAASANRQHTYAFSQPGATTATATTLASAATDETSNKPHEKLNICLLISFIVALVNFVVLIALFASVDSTVSGYTGWEAVGAEIGMTFFTSSIMFPLVCTLLGAVFNGLGLFLRKDILALIGAIIYAVSLAFIPWILFGLIFFFVAAEIILSFVGFAQMHKAQQNANQAIPAHSSN